LAEGAFQFQKLIEFLNVVIVDLALDGTGCAAIGMIGSYERPSPASQQTQSRPAQAMPLVQRHVRSLVGSGHHSEAG
jgi:hypothetical protein